VDYFVETKRAEARAAHAEVTSWELDRYLSAI
jgi:glutamine synthetase